MLESIIAGRIRDHAERQNVVSESQQELIKGKSCLSKSFIIL